MPVPEITANSIRFRQIPPKGFTRFLNKIVSPGITFVEGFKSGGGSETQSVVFDRKKFNVVRAKKWLRDHDMKTSEMGKPNAHLSDIGKFKNIVGLSEKDIILESEHGKEKKQIVMTAFQEGPGNQVDNRWYTAEAVRGAGRLFEARKKFFFNHLRREQDASEQDLKDWCATLKETWIETIEGQVHRKVRLQIHDDFLWTRCKEAPEEIALSIEGKGAGRETTVEGQKRMLIEKIYFLNATKFVTYSGNADMGANLVESEAAQTQEDDEMKLEELTVESLREGRPDLVQALTESITEKIKEDAKKATKAKGDKEKGDIAGFKVELEERFSAAIGDMKKGYDKTIQTLKDDLSGAQKKTDALEVQAVIKSKEEKVDNALKESGLPKEAKTANFKSYLMGLSEKEGKDDKGEKKVITVDEQIKTEIEERVGLIAGKSGKVADSGDDKSGSTENMTEEEKQVAFSHEVLGEGPNLAEYRKDKEDKAAKKKKDGGE